MHSMTRFKAGLVLASVLIASCGGEDSNSPNAGDPGAGTPSPTTQSSYPPAPIGGLAATSFDTFGWVRDERAGTVARSEDVPMSISWDGSTYYTASFDQIGSGRLRYFPFEEGINKSIFTLEKPDLALIPVSINVRQLDQISQAARVMTWRSDVSATDTVGAVVSGNVAVGKRSQAAPSSGSRVYRDAGTGQSQITLDFESGQVAGQLAIVYSDPFVTLPPYIIPLENVVLDSDKLGFSGEFSIPGVTEKGMVEGRLFEPGVNSLAIRIEGRLPDVWSEGTVPVWYVWVMPVVPD